MAAAWAGRMLAVVAESPSTVSRPSLSACRGQVRSGSHARSRQGSAPATGPTLPCRGLALGMSAEESDPIRATCTKRRRSSIRRPQAVERRTPVDGASGYGFPRCAAFPTVFPPRRLSAVSMPQCVFYTEWWSGRRRQPSRRTNARAARSRGEGESSRSRRGRRTPLGRARRQSSEALLRSAQCAWRSIQSCMPAFGNVYCSALWDHRPPTRPAIRRTSSRSERDSSSRAHARLSSAVGPPRAGGVQLGAPRSRNTDRAVSRTLSRVTVPVTYHRYQSCRTSRASECSRYPVASMLARSSPIENA